MSNIPKSWDMVYNGYYKVMSNIPKMGHLMTHVIHWGFIHNGIMLGGWPTPLKNDGVSNTWDGDIPNWMESHKNHVPNHQPGFYDGNIVGAGI